MQVSNLFSLFILPLAATNVRYMITGSVASIVYGRPRLTHDIDIVINLPYSDIAKLHDAFAATDYYLPSVDIISLEAARSQRGHFNIIHNDSGYKCDIFMSGNDALMAWGLTNTRQIDFDNVQLRIAPPEYVIVKKLEFYQEGHSEKHIKDIRAMLNETTIDEDTLAKFISERHLEEHWKLCLGSDLLAR